MTLLLNLTAVIIPVCFVYDALKLYVNKNPHRKSFCTLVWWLIVTIGTVTMYRLSHRLPGCYFLGGQFVLGTNYLANQVWKKVRAQ